MSPIQDVASHLIEEKEHVSERVILDLIAKLNLRLEDIEEHAYEESRSRFSNLAELMGKALVHEPVEIFAEVERWSRNLGEQAAQNGEPLDQTLAVIPNIRAAFLRYVGRISQENALTFDEYMVIQERINHTLDISINETIKAHDQFKLRLIELARIEAAELSAPIVPILHKIAVLPLIGTIDTFRAEQIHNKVIPKIAALDLNILIIDLSGIQVIDTLVTDHLFRIYNVLRLIGVHVVLTGIRPELAQTAIGIGLDFSSIETYLTVQQALSRLTGK